MYFAISCLGYSCEVVYLKDEGRLSIPVLVSVVTAVFLRITALRLLIVGPQSVFLIVLCAREISALETPQVDI